VKGLAGKRVAVPQIAGTQDIALRHALQQVGLTSTDKGGNVTIVATTPADALTLFQKKELDAAWMAEPWIARLVQEGNGTLLLDERDAWPDKKFSTTVVIMRTEFLEKNPELVKKFLEAHVATVDWIGTHRSEAQKLIGERIKTLTTKALPDAILSDALSRTEFTTDPLKETVLETANRARSLGYQREDAALLKDLFDLRTLDSVGKLQEATKKDAATTQ
jgi:NitT/TauT family transport system substrate-binding protein